MKIVFSWVGKKAQYELDYFYSLNFVIPYSCHLIRAVCHVGAVQHIGSYIRIGIICLKQPEWGQRILISSCNLISFLVISVSWVNFYWVCRTKKKGEGEAISLRSQTPGLKAWWRWEMASWDNLKTNLNTAQLWDRAGNTSIFSLLFCPNLTFSVSCHKVSGCGCAAGKEIRERASVITLITASLCARAQQIKEWLYRSTLCKQKPSHKFLCRLLQSN